MQLQRQSNGELLELDPRTTLGAGGEARVFLLGGEEGLVAKVYRRPSEAQVCKLAAMIANPPDDPMAARGHVSIAWPLDLLLTADASNRPVGFVMPRAAGTRPVIDFYNPMTRRRECPLFSYLYLHRTARNIASAVHAVHARGYVIGDVNESNILVTDTALATLVDTDSFQVRDARTGTVYRCPVGKPEFTPPELQGETFREIDRAPEHDRFGLAVLIFQLLMEGTHPFAGVYAGGGDPPSYAARIQAGHFAYGNEDVPYHPMPVAPPFGILPAALQALFVRCFQEGFRDPSARPDAETWVNALHEAENALVTCKANAQHRYGDHLRTCPWCDRAARLGGRDPFPSKHAVLYGEHLREPEPTQVPLPSAAVTPIVASITIPAMPPPTPSPAPAPASQNQSATAALAVAPPDLAAALPAPRRPNIVTAPRRPVAAHRRPIAWRPIAAAGALVILGGLAFVVGSAQVRRSQIAREVQRANRLIAQARSGHDRLQAAEMSDSSRAAIEAERRNAGEAMDYAHRALAIDPGDRDARAADSAARASQVRADADDAALQAALLVQDVTAAIERYKNQTLTEDQANAIRDSLKKKLQDAQAAAGRAISLDPQNRQAWIQRVRALHLAADSAGAEAALDQALALFPRDAELLRLQRLIRGSRQAGG